MRTFVLATALVAGLAATPVHADTFIATVASVDARGNILLTDKSTVPLFTVKVEGDAQPGSQIQVEFAGDENGYAIKSIKVVAPKKS